jgi:hypothetical protein
MGYTPTFTNPQNEAAELRARNESWKPCDAPPKIQRVNADRIEDGCITAAKLSPEIIEELKPKSRMLLHISIGVIVGIVVALAIKLIEKYL